MKAHKKELAADKSGQLIIVTALAIAILISTTTAYIYELGMEKTAASAQPISNYIFALKISTRNAVISSLANISNFGEKTTLEVNLKELSRFLKELHTIGVCSLNFTLPTNAEYDSGIRISWDTNVGVSSALVDFVLNFHGLTENATANYTVNITTAITVNGQFTQTEEGKLVNLTCRLYNEGDYALAKNISIFYENFGTWIPIDASNNLLTIDYGNGTYSISFTVDVSLENVHVLVKVFDLRNIFIQAEAFCHES
jgi:hypothetical protein